MQAQDRQPGVSAPAQQGVWKRHREVLCDWTSILKAPLKVLVRLGNTYKQDSAERNPPGVQMVGVTQDKLDGQDVVTGRHAEEGRAPAA